MCESSFCYLLTNTRIERTGKKENMKSANISNFIFQFFILVSFALIVEISGLNFVFHPADLRAASFAQTEPDTEMSGAAACAALCSEMKPTGCDALK